MRLFFILAACYSISSITQLSAFSEKDLSNFYEGMIAEAKGHLQDGNKAPAQENLAPSILETYPVVRDSLNPISPRLGYAPLVIVNNTGLDATRLYFLGTGNGIDSTAHFLKPNRTTGVCTYASSSVTNSVDPGISVKLSSLPTNGTNSYYIYVPLQLDGRCYISVDRPLYLETTDGSIRSPSVTASNDPSYYTIYQNFELTLDAGYDLYANVSNLEYYSLSIALNSFTYPTGKPYTTLDGLISSGFSETTSRQAILTGVRNALINKDFSVDPQWSKLIVPFYDKPYEEGDPLTDLRILSPKKSINFASGIFKDAAMHPFMTLKDRFGLGYALDCDDLLALGGQMRVNIQSCGISNPSSPYYELTLGLIDTDIPNPTLAYGPYRLTINPISASAEPINIVYSTNAATFPNMICPVPQSGGPVLLTNIYNCFWVQYAPSTASPNTYEVYPKHQLVLPKAKRYNSMDASLMSGISFTEVNGQDSQFTLSLPSL